MPWRPKRTQIPWRTVAKVLLPVLALVVAIELGAHVLEQRTPPQRARTLRERAVLHAQVRQFEEAARALEEAAALEPDDVQTALILAQVRQAQGRLADAEGVLRAAHASRPGDPAVSVPLARLLLDTGRALDAAEVLEPELSAIRKVTDPVQRIDALLVAGRAAAGRGALLQAEALFREATRTGNAPVTTVAKAAAEACLALADLLTRSGRLAAAREALEAARTFTPWDPRIALGRARVLELAGRTDEAVGQLFPLVESSSGPDLVVAAALGDVLLRARRTDAVADLASRVASAPSGQELAGSLRAAAALESGDVQRAKAEADRFVETNPRSAAAHLARGRAAQALGSLEDARAAYEAALLTRPELVDAHVALLEIEERLGRREAVASRAVLLLERSETRCWALRALLTLAISDPSALERGRARLETLRSARPGDTRLRVQLGLLRLATGEVDRAADDLEPLTSAPDLASAASTLADAAESRLVALLAVESLAAVVMRLQTPQAPAARLLAARVLERLDRPGLASHLLGESAATPSREEAALRVGLALQAGAPAAAVDALERLRAASPDDGAVLAALGELRLATGELHLAHEAFEAAARVSSTSAHVNARLGRALAGLGDTPAAEAAYARARALDPRAPIGHEDAVLPLVRGEAALAAARLREALQATGDRRFALALVAAEAADGQPARALEAFRGASPAELANTHLLGAALIAEAGDRPRARQAARRVAVPAVVQEAAAAPGSEVARRAMWTLVALETVQWEEPVRAQVEAILADRQADALSAWLAWDAAQRVDAGLAVRVGKQVRQLASDDAWIALRLAAALRAAGDPASEAALVRQVIQGGVQDARLLTELGMALERTGDAAEAERRYREALSASGGADPVAHNNLACLLALSPSEARRLDALEHAREAARLAPSAPEAIDTLGWVHHLLGQHDHAVGLLERAAARLPAHPTVRYHLAEALAAVGRVDHARLALEYALVLPGGWAEEALARSRLDELKQSAPR